MCPKTTLCICPHAFDPHVHTNPLNTPHSLKSRKCQQGQLALCKEVDNILYRLCVPAKCGPV